MLAQLLPPPHLAASRSRVLVYRRDQTASPIAQQQHANRQPDSRGQRACCPPALPVRRGEGAGWRSVRSAQEAIARLLPAYQVATLSCAALLAGDWQRGAALLVMPGGADLPYCRHLAHRGNQLIREFVTSGGAYLGLCAGAYYACTRVEFEPGSGSLEVVGDRELAFFPGIARGAAFPGFDYRNEAGAAAAQLEFLLPPQLAASQELPRRPEQQRGPAAGRWVSTLDYSNGGPVFLAPDGSTQLEAFPGVRVLARYVNLPPRPELGWPAAAAPAARSSVQALPAAAVACAVGCGRAVLCGTHPELHHDWLDDSGCSSAREGPQPAAHEPLPPQARRSDAGPGAVVQAGPEGSVALAAHTQALRAQLASCAGERDALLAALLLEALTPAEG